MTADEASWQLSGRIDAAPADVVHDEVLAPQFRFEAEHLLPHYILIERVLLREYRRLGVFTAEQAAVLDDLLQGIDRRAIGADPTSNYSDIAFAIEVTVGQRAAECGLSPAPAWHLDRSRNDLQATAQRMYLRARLVDIAGGLAVLIRSLLSAAERYLSDPMPGQTHLQPAQVISPGFYFTAIAGELLETLDRLAEAFRQTNRCPLGAGAMAGGELAWDRDRLAADLGFGCPVEHALTAVASRTHVLAAAGALSILGVTISRFISDLMLWGSSTPPMLDLPDELSGISSAMPQKKNFPILERIRGRSAHLSGLSADLAAAQHSTTYTNLVEVSKEATSTLPLLLDSAASVLRLCTVVCDRLELDRAVMRAACDREYLGGFALANRLTQHLSGLSWRQAQVLAGRYIVAATASRRAPADVDPELLSQLARDAGHVLDDPAEVLEGVFDPDRALGTKVTAGSTHPEQVSAMRAQLAAGLAERESHWRTRRAACRATTVLHSGGPA